MVNEERNQKELAEDVHNLTHTGRKGTEGKGGR
jgi:hypothetical protein